MIICVLLRDLWEILLILFPFSPRVSGYDTVSEAVLKALI